MKCGFPYGIGTTVAFLLEIQVLEGVATPSYLKEGMDPFALAIRTMEISPHVVYGVF